MLQNVYVRLALYVLSTILLMVPLGWAEYGVYVDTESLRVTVDFKVLVSAIFTGFAMSTGILRRWGVR